MPGLAPQLAAFGRRLFNLPAPARASGEASTGQPVQIEMLVDGTWADITAYDMVRDDSGNIPISYGITSGEGSQTDRAQATLTLKNQDARFTRRNPSGPYYGAIGKGTQFRVSVPDGSGGKSYRIWGEADSWVDDWDSTGTDVWVETSVAGIMQRLAQGPAPERSVIYTAITDPPPTGLVAYWPMEDASDATSLASGLTNGSPMTWTGTPTLASYDGVSSSDPLPDITSAILSGSVARYDDPTATQVRFLVHIPTDGLSDGKVICSVDQTTTGGTAFWELFYTTTGKTLWLRQNDGDGALLGTELQHTLDVRGRLLYVSIELQENGALTDRALRLRDVTSGTVYSVTDSGSGSGGLTRVTRIQFGPASRSAVGPVGTANLPGVAVGHCTVENALTAIDALGARLNPIGETAGRRIQRLCGEQGIQFEWIGDLDDTTPMGAQPKQNLLAHVQEACLADGGLLYETRDVLGLGYRTRTSLYNQTPAVVLSYTGYNFAEVPRPSDDDRYIQNFLTVTVGGVSASYEQTDGTLGTGAIGKYGESSGLTLNLATTDSATLSDAAAWRVHLGTVDEDRYPTITVNLAHPSITPDLRRAILALRMGDRAQFTGMPTWVAPGDPDQLILGMSETISHFEHRLIFTCAPASPYSYIGILDDDIARLDTDGSTLYQPAGASDVTLQVGPAAGQTGLWTTDPDEFPFTIQAGGEVMTVTGITGGVSDSFDRNVTSGWGATDTGETWTLTGGAASDFNVVGV